MLAIFLIIAGALLRLMPHIPNFAPITAIALFGGVYLNKKYALILPFLTMLISDYLILYINPFDNPIVDFHKIYPLTASLHSTTLYVYGSFLLSGRIGIYLKNNKNFKHIAGGTLLASIQFFLITNFGVWATGTYDKGIDGLLQSYVMGIPFFKYTLLGDMFYTGVMLGAYELVARSTKNLYRFSSLTLLHRPTKE